MNASYYSGPPPGFVLRRIKTPAGRIAIWERQGSGPALVLIHGNSASKSAFRRLLRESVFADRRVLVLDLPGAGESENARDPEADYTFTAMAQTIQTVLIGMNAVRPIVLGWSLGGHLAIEAIGQGADFAALILTGTPPCGPGAEEVATVFYPNEMMEVVTGEAPPPELLEAYIRVLYGKTEPIDLELFEAGRRFDGRMRRVFSANLMEFGTRSGTPRPLPQRAVVAKWENPISVIQGDEEPFFDPRALDSLHWNNLWRGRVQFVSGTGHAPFYEKPDAYGALLAAFLTDIGAR